MTRIGADDWRSSRKELYRALLDEGHDLDSLHDLLVRKGPGLLDRSMPYLAVAIRNRTRTTWQREQRRREVERDDGPPAPSIFDPADRVTNIDELRCVTHVLDKLDRASMLLLWWQAAGYNDDEIAELWNEACLEPQDPSPEMVRKRRQRARAHVRSLFDRRNP